MFWVDYKAIGVSCVKHDYVGIEYSCALSMCCGYPVDVTHLMEDCYGLMGLKVKVD